VSQDVEKATSKTMGTARRAQPRRRSTPHGRCARGFSLVEAVVAAGIVGIMLLASVNLLGGAVRARAADNDHRTALMLAQQLMAEIQQQPYKDESLTAVLFGPELGESTADRSAFDDVDDYNGFIEKPPRLKDGTLLSGYGTWKRKVTVKYVMPGSLATSLADTGLELIEVKAIDASGHETSVTALRSAYTAVDPPASGTTSLLFTTVELDAGGSTPRLAAGGAVVLAQPRTP
jgi:type II secretory pathway pseudopilin PulG